MRGLHDTIAAVSTPWGRAGIGIVRLSGPDAIAIASGLFRPAGALAPGQQPTMTLRYGHVMDGDEVVDEALLTVMRAPRTYTTQDVVEINCHGGLVPLRRTLELALAGGARLADPGEFTRRAFCFGRIDLSQAEAVADVINARTDAARRAAIAQLGGGLSERTGRLRDRIVALLAHLETLVDFCDDEAPPLQAEGVTARIADLEAEVAELLGGARQGRLLREGARVAIIGRPNVGKSSLMNALLGHERAIVTPIPGTTRDVVEETLCIRGIPVVLSDTAGMRDSDDPVERAGVERGREVAAAADVVMLVLDGSEPLQAEDLALLKSADARTLLVINKSDLAQSPEVTARAAASPSAAVSALHGTGLDALRDMLGRALSDGQADAGVEALVTNARHIAALQGARVGLIASRKAAEEALSEEYVAEGLRSALNALGEIVGETLPEEVIDRIFDTFCVGK